MGKKGKSFQRPQAKANSIQASSPQPSMDKESKLEDAQLEIAILYEENIKPEESETIDQLQESEELQKQVSANSLLESWHQLKQLWKKAENQKEQYEKERKALGEELEKTRQDQKSLESRRKQYETLETAKAELAEREERLLQREIEAEAGFADKLKTHLDRIEKQLTELAAQKAKLDEEREALDQQLQDKLDELGRQYLERQRLLDAEHNTRMQLLREEERKLNNKNLDLLGREELLKEDQMALLDVQNRMETAENARLRAKIQQQESLILEYQKMLSEKDQTLLEHEKDMKALGHRTPKQTAEELKSLRAECDRLQQELATSLSAEERARLTALQDANDKLRLELKTALESREDYRHKYQKIEIPATQLEDQARKIVAQQSTINLNQQMIDDLRKEIDGYTKKNEAKKAFELCMGIDENKSLGKEKKDHHEFNSLGELTEYLRNRIATVEEAQLFYSERMIRTFLAGLAIGKLTILQGISGTGKTSLPRAFAKAISGADNSQLGANADLQPFAIVEVQSGWRDRQDLLGYFNTFESKYYETTFLSSLYRARTPRFQDTPFLVILDEMNLSHPEHYFADLLSQIENEEVSRELKIVSTSKDIPKGFNAKSDGIYLPLPPNVWFIGTANHDETTLQFAPKTYDRANVMEMPIHPDKFKPTENASKSLSYPNLIALFTKAEEYHRKDVSSANAFLSEKIKPLVEPFGIGWGNRLEKQISKFLPVFLESGGNQGEALDHLIASKVLRNLKNRFDIKKDHLEKLQADLAKAFTFAKMEADPIDCISLIQSELRRHS